jgi:serine/threonine protein kinase
MFNSLQYLGELPDKFTVSKLLSITQNSPEVLEIYDRAPNLVVRITAGDQSFVYKRFGWRSNLHFFLSPTFKSRAQASWDTAQAILQNGGNTPKPLFVYTRRFAGFILENIYLCQAVHPHVQFRKLNPAEHSSKFLQKVVYSLAGSIGKMHNANIAHNDLTTGNFLVDQNGTVFIVDLNRAKVKQGLSLKNRLTDLARINLKHLSKADDSLVNTFFDRYAEISNKDIDWISAYWSYRERRLRWRRLRKRLKNSLGF